MVMGGISHDGCKVWTERPGGKDAMEALDDRGGVGKAVISGVKVGVPRREVLALGSAMLGD